MSKKPMAAGVLTFMAAAGGVEVQIDDLDSKIEILDTQIEKICLLERSPLDTKFDAKTIDPKDYKRLKEIDTEGCGIKEVKRETLNDSAVESDGELFLHYNRASYKARRDELIDKMDTGTFEDLNEFTQDYRRYIRYETEQTPLIMKRVQNLSARQIREVLRARE